MGETTDEQFLRRAIRLAMSGRGRVEPNPMVGCVIVKKGRVIGEGYHAQYGGPHAEPNALAACTESPAGATVYVTLEPCCHTNKQTPPCAPRLIEAKVARIVVGCLDPNPDVNGNGVAMLRGAGIEVVGPVLEAPAKQLIAPFLARMQHRRPYVSLKWAESANGKVAAAGGRPVQISNAVATQFVHELRSRSDAIVVGVNTVLTDDPLLTARCVANARNPSRFILDRDLRTPADARVIRDKSASATILHGFFNDAKKQHRRAGDFEQLGVHTALVPLDADGLLSLEKVTRRIFDAYCYEVLVEPGPTLARSFLAGGHADRFFLLRSEIHIPDDSAPAAASIPSHWVKVGEADLGGDSVIEYLNSQSSVFFAAESSADLVLVGGAGA
ncbi:MAG: bifunctional diaminohydroxyphosphoribosylaminopyrimidine deaminase/5-amino-6-(5-phosphoribosylamino)uracil reductase RibD [Planctomycetota bacterium]|nr:bifunctional diaminohydroxyphosphoribosylaminopyrimidine deaminase/5-amino-6-(5-phosphoribosylamino)uracil reductase RibD [Planctomycetota bacterium]